MSIAIDIHEWQKISFATHKQLAHLELPDDYATQQIIRQLARKRFKIIEQRKGLVIEASSHVGRITLGDVQITVHPKIEALPLLRLMRYAYGLQHIELFTSAIFSIEAFTFQELIIYQFVCEVNELLSRGLHRQYVRKDESLISPRGRINTQPIAHQGGIMQAALPCTHYLRLDDCLLNQVLLQGVLLGIRLTNDDTLRLKLQHLERFHLSGITPIKLDWHTLNCTRRALNRLTPAYASVLTLIEILLASSGISMEGQYQALQLPGFLFDMNLFFQHLLERFLQEHLPEYEVRLQHKLGDMMIYTQNPRKRGAPELRPDYIIRQRGKTVAILDAKYRDLWQEKLPSEMLYQLVMYALSQDYCNSATILYPTTSSTTKEARIEVLIPAHQQGGAHVMLRPVDLLQLDTLLQAARVKDNMQERANFAQWLVYGT